MDLDLALIGNCQYSALVDPRGRVVWTCFPRFDSPSVFGALLDSEFDTLILTADGRYVYHPDPVHILNRTILDDASGPGADALKNLAARITRGESGIVHHDPERLTEVAFRGHL